MAVKRVTINNHFCIQTMQVAFWCNNQRIYFKQRQVFFFKQFCQTNKNVNELINLLTFQTKLKCQLARLERLRAC